MRKLKKDMANGPLFLNVPINSSAHDVIGIETYVEKLEAAIDAGAQMIAITSPFGAGKSSVIELLQKKRREQQNDLSVRWRRGKERFIEVSMWSHLGEARADSCADLHKTFVYQLASQIAPEKGTYVNRRLSQNYGLLRLYTNSRMYWLFTLGAIVLGAAWWGLYTFSDQLRLLIPQLDGRIGLLSAILLFGMVFLAAFILTHADILFSSNKSEGERTVEGDEIIDLYRSEVLKSRYLHWKWWRQLKKGTHYIVVIEDLDRTDSNEVIFQFLKELRKYYIPGNPSISYLNRVTFLVNIKPEADLTPSDAASKAESLYAKIFDYTLQLRTINIDNYDAVLDGLLAEHRKELQSLGLSLPEGTALSKLPGMQWIIRERKLGIREIKERLNIAFSLFESLRQRFSSGGIVFEKCAAVAYLVTAFEADFCKTDDRAYQELVDSYLKESSEQPFQSVIGNYGKVLPGTSKEYQRAVWELIRAKLIDSSYRIYFYNYPQESRFYTSEETAVLNAILYDEPFPDLDRTAEALIRTGSPIIEDAYQRLIHLGIRFPGFVLSTEPLFIMAVRICFDRVLDQLANLDYSLEAAQKNLQIFERILSFDAKRQVLGKIHAEKLCTLWEQKMEETSLLQLRKMLCEAYSKEIDWYSPLFFGVHTIITQGEMEHLTLPHVLNLIDQKNKNFSTQEVDYVIQRFSRGEESHTAQQVENFLREALAVLGIEKIAAPLLQFMCAHKRIVPDFESAVGELIATDYKNYGNMLFPMYQNLVNQIAPQGFEAGTASRISKIDQYDGYTPATAKCLMEHGFSMAYVLLTLCQGLEIPYGNEQIINAIQKEEAWLFQKHPDLFKRLRLDLVSKSPVVMERYNFLFGAARPIMSSDELHALSGLTGDIESKVIRLVAADRVTEDETSYLRDFFCRRKQTNATTMNILQFAGRMEDFVAEEFFFSLDFSKVRYRSLSRKCKLVIKDELNEILELDRVENKLKFIKATGYLDPVWEKELLPDLKEDQSLQIAYVSAVNSCEKLSGETIEVITNLGPIYATAPHVTEKAFQAKKYFWYATSKIQWEKKFVMESGERGELLWRTYLDIFGTFRNQKWDDIKQAMRKSEEFLYKIMKTKAYRSFDDESRMGLVGILQDKDSIVEIIGRGTQFALRYFCKIEGFQDWDAANAFVDLISKDPVLLASEELYEHTHDRLVNGALKGKYTNRRKNLLK